MSTRPRLPKIVYALGAVSFLTDLGSEMIVPLLPVFLEAIGGSPVQLGLLIGASDLVVSLLRVVSGALSDRMRRRKPWLLTGYALSSLVRPLFALVQGPWQAIAVRTGDRVGKGLRSAPRDALIADATAPELRGRAFGVQRSLDHAGAFAGGLLAFALLAAGCDLRLVFALAIVPGVAAVVVILGAVRDIPAGAVSGTGSVDPPDAVRRLLPFLGVAAFAAVAASIDLFALLRARELGCEVALLPLLWVVLHTTRSLLAGRLGALSDRIGRRAVIAMGLLAHALVLTGFAFVTSLALIWPLFLLLGLHAAFTEGAERGFVADITGASKRGTAFGVYYTVQGVAAFAGPVTIGAVWQQHGASFGFGVAAGAALIALLLLGCVRRPAAVG